MTSRLYVTCRGRYGANSGTFEYTYFFYQLNMLNEVQKSKKKSMMIMSFKKYNTTEFKKKVQRLL